MPSTTIYANKGTRVARRSSDGWEAGSGASNYLPVGLYGGYLYRTLLGFSYSFTGWTAISSATLNLRTSTQFYVAFGSDPDIYIQRITESWSEGTSGDLSSGNATHWGNMPNRVSTNQATLDVSTAESDWVSVDITALMQDALAAGVFYGLNLRAVFEDDGEDVTEFYSDDTTSEPYISITYSTNTAPNAPTSLSPTGDEVKNTLTPTFSGTFSDPDAGDSMSAYQIVVYEDDGTTLKWDSGTIVTLGYPTTFSKQYTGSSLTGNQFYKWKARTRDAAGTWGAYSALQRFKANSTPTAPTRSISGTASDLDDLTPVLYVTHNDADATDQNMLGYRVIVYRDSDDSVMWDTGDTSVSATRTLSLTYAGAALSWATDYYFKARTKDSNGAWSPYCSTYAFSTHQTGAPVFLSPGGGAIADSLTPTLTAKRASTNDSFASAEIEVYESDGTTLKWSSGSFTSGVTSSQITKVYAGSALTAGSTYKWRCRATGATGGTSDWSDIRTFVAPDATAPTAESPIGFGIADLTPDFQFSRSTAFDAYQLIVYEDDGVTQVWDTGTVAMTSATSKTVTYAGPALSWGETYVWKVRVSSTGGSVWSPYSGSPEFQTGDAGTAVLTAPTEGSWETTVTPTFTGDTEGGETIATFRILLYASDGTTLIWDSGELAGSGTSFSKVYNGSSALTKGSQYVWKARYSKTGGIPGDYSATRTFHINADPTAPSGLSPAAGAIVDSLTPDFYATFNDADISAWGDTPSEYEVEVYRVSDDTLMHSLSKTVGLEVGQNSVARAAEGTALSFEVEYSWRARYTDSKAAAGTWSSLRVFKPSEPPTVTIDTPTTTLASPAFSVSWSYASPGSKAQSKYRVVVTRSSDSVTIYDTGEVNSTAASWDMPSGYLLNGETYDVIVTVWDVDGLSAEDSVNALADWTAPAAPADFSAAADPATSTVHLRWTASALDAEDFSYYAVYRREVGEDSWTPYAVITTQSTVEYDDQFAANGVLYDYKVTQFQHIPGDVDLESEEESIASAILDVDEWFVVGADGAEDHCFELPVYQEGHQKPVQQEVFEPLGSRRKKSARGNVLGNEGTLEMTFTKDERDDAKRRLEYLAETAGPHILKSPFGDVWQVEFAGPVYKYTGAGHMTVTLAWIEVA